MGVSIAQSTPVYKDANNQVISDSKNKKNKGLNMD